MAASHLQDVNALARSFSEKPEDDYVLWRVSNFLNGRRPF